VTDSPEPRGSDSELSSLVRSVRRLTIAVWCLVAGLLVSYIVPWATYFLRSTWTSDRTTAVGPQPGPSAPAPVYEFDNDFHARPPEEMIKRASMIVLTEIRREQGKHRQIISEIVKRAPDVRFYYKVGDDFSMLSHMPVSDCRDCEGQGAVVFLLGNPAQMASSYSYRDGRIDGMGDMPLEELRRLAQSPPAVVP
jgi:hypothetical protein